MTKRTITLYFTIFLMHISIFAWGQEKPSTRVVSERFIAQINSSWILRTLTLSPDCRHLAYGVCVPDTSFVVVDGEKGKPYYYLDTLFFSPDSKHLAYVTHVNRETFVVVDGKEGKRYSYIEKPMFIWDSKKVACKAFTGDKWLIVVDGEELKQYCSA